jgi:hypothetical protein
LERNVQELSGGFSVFEALRDDTQSERLYARDGFVTIRAVTHDASQCRHFGEPSPVVFAIEFNRKRHVGTVTSGPAV